MHHPICFHDDIDTVFPPLPLPSASPRLSPDIVFMLFTQWSLVMTSQTLNSFFRHAHSRQATLKNSDLGSTMIFSIIARHPIHIHMSRIYVTCSELTQGSEVIPIRPVQSPRLKESRVELRLFLLPMLLLEHAQSFAYVCSATLKHGQFERWHRLKNGAK